MKNRLTISIDDHFVKILIRALREQAKRDTGIYKMLQTGFANKLEKKLLKYQTEQAAILEELRGINQAAATSQIMEVSK